ncbi:phospholipase D family protein [Albidovulum sp.]|uniref:phospholipase D family protein n=1 Tax=Albidovulum sp. TaxID=1872424 RepID=UPI0039B9334D
MPQALAAVLPDATDPVPRPGSVAPRVEVLVTAAEAYPALERAFLAAEREISASFRIFDLTTKLRSAEARQVGDTWFDLVAHTLGRGVALRIVIADFDPVARPRLHRATWRTVRWLHAAAELAGPGARLRVVPAMHPATAGLVPRLLLWPVVLSRLLRTTGWLGGLVPPHRLAVLRELPGVRRFLAGPPAAARPRPRLAALPPLHPATHHQKLAVFDRRQLYIGGLDLDDRFYDTPDHRRPSDETWHDVQLMVEGPVAEDAHRHIAGFLGIAGRRLPPGPVAPDRDGLRFVRTLSRRRSAWPGLHISPDPAVTEIEEAHHRAVAAAQRLIYVETQYFRDRRLARRLALQARRMPGLTMILVLPAAPDDIAFEGAEGMDARLGEFLQAEALRILRRGFGARLFVGGAAQPRATRACGRAQLNGAPLVYVHAKVSIFDAATAIVSSANLNGRSLRWDSEAGLVITRPEAVVALRGRLMAHWLPRDADAACLDPDRAAVAWAALACRNAARAAAEREGFLLPYDAKPAEAFGRAFPLVPDELV